MMPLIVAASAWMPERSKLAVPAGVGIAVAVEMLLLTSTGPLTPEAPVWMCARMIFPDAGMLRTVKAISTVPPVMALALSRVGVMVIRASPVAADSALVIGGTSLAAANVAVNTIGWFDGAA